MQLIDEIQLNSWNEMAAPLISRVNFIKSVHSFNWMKPDWLKWIAPFGHSRTHHFTFNQTSLIDLVKLIRVVPSLRGLFFTRIKFHLIAVNSWRLAGFIHVAHSGTSYRAPSFTMFIHWLGLIRDSLAYSSFIAFNPYFVSLPFIKFIQPPLLSVSFT